MLVGVEVEFFLMNTSGNIIEMLPEDMERFRLKPEFYRGMYEKTYLFHNFEEEKDQILSDLKEIADLYRASIPLKSVLIPIPEGAASCGIHIHIDEIKDPALTELLLVYSKFKLNPSLRFLHSHHVWGAIREYSRDWKRKPRFRPLVFSPDREDKPPTWEVRIYDLEDLTNGVLERGLHIIQELSKGKKPTKTLIRKAEKVMENLKNLDAEKIFGYHEDVSEDTALLLYKILNRRCPSYKVIGSPLRVTPRFYSLTNLDNISINERIFEITTKTKKNTKEVKLCAV